MFELGNPGIRSRDANLSTEMFGCVFKLGFVLFNFVRFFMPQGALLQFGRFRAEKCVHTDKRTPPVCVHLVCCSNNITLSGVFSKEKTHCWKFSWRDDL